MSPGYVRCYEQCVKCGRVYYRDYVPFSLSNPILTLPCGHGVGQRWENITRKLDPQEGMRIMLEQMQEKT